MNVESVVIPGAPDVMYAITKLKEDHPEDNMDIVIVPDPRMAPLHYRVRMFINGSVIDDTVNFTPKDGVEVVNYKVCYKELQRVYNKYLEVRYERPQMS